MPMKYSKNEKYQLTLFAKQTAESYCEVTIFFFEPAFDWQKQTFTENNPIHILLYCSLVNGEGKSCIKY